MICCWDLGFGECDKIWLCLMGGGDSLLGVCLVEEFFEKSFLSFYYCAVF